jgi:hypothetical protein
MIATDQLLCGAVITLYVVVAGVALAGIGIAAAMILDTLRERRAARALFELLRGGR